MNNQSNKKVTLATVVYLVKDVGGVPHICLAQKQQNIHKDNGETLGESKKLNGYGGKKEETDSSLRACAIRELFDECGVAAQGSNLIEIAQVQFFWPGNTTDICDMDVAFYFLKKYEGEPAETDEMGPPQFFSVNKVPYGSLMGADEIIIRNGFMGNHTSGNIYFLEKGSKRHRPELTVRPR